MKTDFGVIVIGGGGSGLAAAVSASENGLEVLVREKRPECGTTTGIAVGSFTGCATSWQRSHGVEDSVAAHLEDVAKFATPELEARNNEALRRLSLCESAATLDWLHGMGIAFQGHNPEPPNRVPRMLNVVPGARAYIATLQTRLLRLGGGSRATVPWKNCCGTRADASLGRGRRRRRVSSIFLPGAELSSRREIMRTLRRSFRNTSTRVLPRSRESIPTPPVTGTASRRRRERS